MSILNPGVGQRGGGGGSSSRLNCSTARASFISAALTAISRSVFSPIRRFSSDQLQPPCFSGSRRRYFHLSLQSWQPSTFCSSPVSHAFSSLGETILRSGMGDPAGKEVHSAVLRRPARKATRSSAVSHILANFWRGCYLVSRSLAASGRASRLDGNDQGGLISRPSTLTASVGPAIIGRYLEAAGRERQHGCAATASQKTLCIMRRPPL